MTIRVKQTIMEFKQALNELLIEKAKAFLKDIELYDIELSFNLCC